MYYTYLLTFLLYRRQTGDKPNVTFGYNGTLNEVSNEDGGGGPV